MVFLWLIPPFSQGMDHSLIPCVKRIPWFGCPLSQLGGSTESGQKNLNGWGSQTSHDCQGGDVAMYFISVLQGGATRSPKKCSNVFQDVSRCPKITQDLCDPPRFSWGKLTMPEPRKKWASKTPQVPLVIGGKSIRYSIRYHREKCKNN